MRRRTRSPRPLAKLALTAAAAALLFLVGAVHVTPAQAATPCWKSLLNDWYDGRIDHTYPVHCYRETLKHLPADVQTYSSAHDDISRALQSAIASTRKAHKPVGPNTLVPPEKGSNSSGGPGSSTTTTAGGGGGGKGGSGGIAGRVPASSPSSVPVPLLVLGGLALLLVAAGGAGLVAKRLQARRPGT